jgi:hypothetical protein
MGAIPFISVRQLLGSPLSPLGRLVAAGRHQDAANAALQEFLEEPLKGRVCVARASSETLTLVADSPAWSARVRYLTPQILDHLRSRLENPRLRNVKIVTRPTESRRPPPPPRRPRLSGRAAELLTSVARASDDPALAAALERLAARATRDERD